MGKKPTLDFDNLCTIITEIKEAFNPEKQRDNTIADRVQEYLIIRSVECPESEIEYLHICKMVWEGTTSFMNEGNRCLAFNEIVNILEGAYCITEGELRTFKKSVLADLRTEITEEE